jgi:hypothetical protein
MLSAKGSKTISRNEGQGKRGIKENDGKAEFSNDIL